MVYHVVKSLYANLFVREKTTKGQNVIGACQTNLKKQQIYKPYTKWSA